MAGITEPCPKWCVSEPEESEGSRHIHRTQRTAVDRYDSGTHVSASTRGGSFGTAAGNEIVVHSWHAVRDSDSVDGDLYVPLKDATRLAAVFEALSYLDPDKIRQLAAGIRQAHAEMEAGA
jgi:hypothetical protein